MKRLSILILAALAAAPAFAATRTWTGTTSNLWSVASNWGGAAPSAGDDLVFPAGASNTSTSNDLPAGTSFNSLTFSGAASYSIGGNAITVGAGGITNNATSPAINVAVTLGATQSFTNSGSNMTLNKVDLNGQSLTLMSTSGSPAINSIISGSGTITKSGAGLWIFNGSNTFSGQLLITAGALMANAANAFGVADDTPSNGTVISAGAQLQLVSPFTYPAEQITVNGSGPSGTGGAMTVLGAGNTTLNGTVILGTSVGLNAVGGSITFNGLLTGSGQLGMSGNGAFVLNNAGNDFTGVVKWGVGGSSDSTLALNVDNALPATVALQIAGTGLFNMQSHTQTIKSAIGTGGIALGSGTPGHLTIAGAPAVTFGGSIGGTGDITVSGGNISFGGSCGFTGTLTNNGGTTSLAGTSFTAPVVQSSGSLGVANGVTTDSITINGGSLLPGLGGNSIAYPGNVAMAAGATYDEVIFGVTSGLYGLLHVTGTVNLGGANLALTGTGAGVVNGTVLKMIDNDGSDAINGTFAGLPQGATINSGPGGFNYVISYTGGDGNDVTLTAVATGLAATTITLNSTPDPATFGTNVTITVAVTSGTPGTPTGTVTIRDNGASIGTAPLVAGTATFTTSSLAVGTHILSATYSGDSTFAGGTSNLKSEQITAPALLPTSTAVTSSLNPAPLGATITFTATVTTTGMPTGNVSFYDGAALLGSGAISGNTATFSTSALGLGSHDITAVYGGNALTAASTSPVLVQAVSSAVPIPTLDPRALVGLAIGLAIIAGKVLRG